MSRRAGLGCGRRTRPRRVSSPCCSQGCNWKSILLRVRSGAPYPWCETMRTTTFPCRSRNQSALSLSPPRGGHRPSTASPLRAKPRIGLPTTPATLRTSTPSRSEHPPPPRHALCALLITLDSRLGFHPPRLLRGLCGCSWALSRLLCERLWRSRCLHRRDPARERGDDAPVLPVGFFEGPDPVLHLGYQEVRTVVYRHICRGVGCCRGCVHIDVETPVGALLVLDGAHADALVDIIAGYTEPLGGLRHAQPLYRVVLRHVTYPCLLPRLQSTPVRGLAPPRRESTPSCCNKGAGVLEGVPA